MKIADPLVSKGKGIFVDRGCDACHGDDGAGTPLAPSLVGITSKFPQDRLVALLRTPNSRMKAGGMPNVDATPDEMTALLAYLKTLGVSSANSAASLNSVPSDTASPNMLGLQLKGGTAPEASRR